MLAALLTFSAAPRLAFANRPPLHQAATEGNLDEVMRLMANDPSLAPEFVISCSPGDVGNDSPLSPNGKDRIGKPLHLLG
jgi:hypothetical protein